MFQITLASLDVLVFFERQNTIFDFRSSVICEDGFIVVSFWAILTNYQIRPTVFNENTKLELTKSIE
jgi:hypothetical protein